MKIKIKSYNGELPDYFTFDKVYEARHRSEHTFFLNDDEGYRLMYLYNNCPNLNGGCWEIVE